MPVTNRHRKILNSLSILAQDVVTGESKYKLASVVIKKRKTLGIGINSYFKSHPLQTKNPKDVKAIYPCAELNAIINANRRFPGEIEGATVYVARIKYTDSTKSNITNGLARPCPSCIKHLKSFGIKRVVYTTDSGFVCETFE